MAVQGQFGLLTKQNARNMGIGGSYRSVGMGNMQRTQQMQDVQMARALGIDGRRTSRGSRFGNDPNFYNRFNNNQQTATESGSSFNWGNAAVGGISGGISGAAAGSAINVPWGTIIGGVLGLFGGGYAAGKS